MRAGVNVAIDVVTAEAHLEGAPEEASSMLEVAVPAGQRSGVLHLEVARGALLSGPKVPPQPHPVPKPFGTQCCHCNLLTADICFGLSLQLGGSHT